MKYLSAPRCLLWLFAFALGAGIGHAQVFISEILFNPPGTDTPNQYIELRGAPNLLLPDGTYLVSVDGDTSANPGKLRNIFDLSGKSIGGNGFLVLLQKGNDYVPSSNANVYVNAGSGAGWGDGASSSINHRGDTELPHAPVSFLLIQCPSVPALSIDIDANDDCIRDGAVYASWTVLDSIGILGNSGFGYAALNFRKSTGALGSGRTYTVPFTADYAGRHGHTTGANENDWVVSNNLGGTAPNWTLGTGLDSWPSVGGTALNNIGLPNFGAAAIPGIVASPSGNGPINENGGTNYYLLYPNTVPAGTLSIQINGEPRMQLSTDGGATFASSRTVNFSSSATPKRIVVRAVNDNSVDISPHPVFVRHTISASSDGQYPLFQDGPKITFDVVENDTLLINEMKVNPPGSDDAPYQYFELKGNPNSLLTNVYFLVIEGDAGNDPGETEWVCKLNGVSLGSGGLLVIAATNCAYTFPAGTTVVRDAQLNQPGGAFSGGTVSFLLLSSPGEITPGRDLDDNDNGVMEDLPEGTTLLDAVGFHDGGASDLVYGGVSLMLGSIVPDAATRFPTNSTQSAAAWFFGDLAGPDGFSLIYDGEAISTNFPGGTLLTPGGLTSLDLQITMVAPVCGDVFDSTNLDVIFYVWSSHTSPDALNVIADSSNPAVVPNANLSITTGPNGYRRLELTPIGIGYANITLTVQNGSELAQVLLPYAASAVGRPQTRFHIASSDSSTAFAVDTNWMFVGDDQNQVIRLYNRHFSALPHRSLDFKQSLQVGPQENGEVDIEASTRVGNRIFWIGSHSHNNLAEARTNRTRIFGTDLSGTGSNATLNFVGMYKFLKVDLLNWDSKNLHGKGSNYYGLVDSAGYMVDPKAHDGSGFNIEGLTIPPGGTSVGWLGFRAPLVPVTNRAKALIIPVLNFTNLAVSGGGEGSAVFGPPIELNLGCRGIRSMEADSQGVLIVAGPPGTGERPMARDFKLYRWNGNPSTLPEELSADVSGLNLEGIVQLPPRPWSGGSTVQLLTDAGITVYYGDDVPAKQLSVTNFKKFRTDWITLGEPALPQACIKSIRVEGPTALLCWCSKPGLTYRVQYKTALDDPQWTDTGSNIPAADAVTCASVQYIPNVTRFFRVKTL